MRIIRTLQIARKQASKAKATRRPVAKSPAAVLPQAGATGYDCDIPGSVAHVATIQQSTPAINSLTALLGDRPPGVAAGRPGFSVIEVGSEQACELLGMSQSALRAARESKLGRHHLRWRFTSETQRVIAWEVPSLMAYKEATRSLGR